MSVRLLAAALCGVVGVLSFPPIGIWPMAFVSIAGFSLVVHGQRSRDGALLGLTYGLGLFGPLLHWTSTYVGAPPWLILAFSQSWYPMLLGAFLPILQARRFWPITAAAAWVAEEALRDRFPFGGFPWGRWAFSQAESPMRWFIAVGGAALLTFMVALVGTLIASAFVGQDILGWSARLAGALALILLGFGLSLPLKPEPSATTVIAAVQGSVPDRGLEFNARRRQVLDNHVNQTKVLAGRIESGAVAKPSIVLWPENASDIDPLVNADAAAVIQQATDAVGVPILVGALLDGPGPEHVTNAGIVWGPSGATSAGARARQGAGEMYVKRHPVPFGEYIPMRSIARAISKQVDLVGRDMVAGSGDGLLRSTPFPIGDVICFEVAYDDLVRSSVQAGAQLLVVQTNNATFGHSGETYQQLAMSKLRAVEHGRTVVQIATSGKSAIIGPDGKVLAESGRLFTPDLLVEKVPLATSRTLATRTGAVVEWLIVAVALLALAGAALDRLRDRRVQRAVYAKSGGSASPSEQLEGTTGKGRE